MLWLLLPVPCMEQAKAFLSRLMTLTWIVEMRFPDKAIRGFWKNPPGGGVRHDATSGQGMYPTIEDFLEGITDFLE